MKAQFGSVHLILYRQSGTTGGIRRSLCRYVQNHFEQASPARQSTVPNFCLPGTEMTLLSSSVSSHDGELIMTGTVQRKYGELIIGGSL